MARTPAAEVVVDAPLVRRLLADQHPELAHLTIHSVSNGWDNAVLRLGDDLAVRLPRREVAADLVRNEQVWLPVLAPRLPVEVPVPVRTGTPTSYYPWHWSVVRWVTGTPAVDLSPAERSGVAEALAAVLLALHEPAPADAPPNPFRGVPLIDRDDDVRARLAALELELSAGVARRLVWLWDDAVAAPVWDGPPFWLHGDPHPANLLLDDGRLVAMLDFGDVTAGDPATDLAAAWLSFDAGGRRRFVAAFGGRYDDATWLRARGWALVLATALLTSSDDAPRMLAVGERAVAELLVDA